VTEGAGHVIDPAGDASRALQAAVALHGPGVLGNAAMLDAFCANRLAGLTGEAVLISSAAQSDVPALLRRQADSLGLDAAIASVAATLSQSRSLDDTACVWVVTEFARALNYPVPARSQPAIVLPQAPNALTQPVSPGGSGGFTDQGDALAPGPAAVGGSAGTLPLGAAALGAAGVGAAGSGAAGSGGSGGPTPPLGTTGPGGGPRIGGIQVNRNALGIAAAVVLVAAYLGIASAAHLSPFAKVSHSTPIVNPSPSDSGLGLVGGGDRSVRGRGPEGTRAVPGAVTVVRYAGVPDLAAGALPVWL
jgi:hypothetical protein